MTIAELENQLKEKIENPGKPNQGGVLYANNNLSARYQYYSGGTTTWIITSYNTVIADIATHNGYNVGTYHCERYCSTTERHQDIVKHLLSTLGRDNSKVAMTGSLHRIAVKGVE